MAILDDIKADGFFDALKNLQDKYDEKYRLAHFYMRKMLNIEQITQASHQSTLGKSNQQPCLILHPIGIDERIIIYDGCSHMIIFVPRLNENPYSNPDTFMKIEK